LRARDLLDFQCVAIDDVRFLSAVGRASAAWVLRIRQEEINIEEVAAVLEATGVGQREDVLSDVIPDEGFGEVVACAVAQAGFAPLGGLSTGASKKCSDASRNDKQGVFHVSLGC